MATTCLVHLVWCVFVISEKFQQFISTNPAPQKGLEKFKSEEVNYNLEDTWNK